MMEEQSHISDSAQHHLSCLVYLYNGLFTFRIQILILIPIPIHIAYQMATL